MKFEWGFMYNKSWFLPHSINHLIKYLGVADDTCEGAPADSRLHTRVACAVTSPPPELATGGTLRLLHTAHIAAEDLGRKLDSGGHEGRPAVLHRHTHVAALPVRLLQHAPPRTLPAERRDNPDALFGDDRVSKPCMNRK